MRTGRRVTQAATASSGCTETSSLPPKPPPQAVGRMRTRVGCEAEHARRLLAVHVGRLRAGRDLDRGCRGRGRWARRSRPRARCRRARRRRCGRCLPRLRRRPHGRRRHRRSCRLPRASTLSGNAACSGGAPGASAASMPVSGGSGCQAMGRSASARPSTAVAAADQRQHRLAAEAHMARREHRLVAQRGEDAEGVRAGDVGGGEDGGEAGGARLDGGEVAEREAGAGVRGADHAQPQGVGGRLVGAEDVGAGHLRPAVDAGEAGADGRSANRRRPEPVEGR